MPRASNFNDYPPFPEDVVVADLPQLSLCKLLENDIVESEKLFRSCRESGFFLLNLTGSSAGKDMLRNAELGFELSQKLFGLEQEELGRYTLNVEESLYGYKSVGRWKLEDGSPDGVDFYGLSQDDMLGISTPRANPEIILANRKTFEDIFHGAHGIICQLLLHLDRHLSLTPGELASLCPQNKPSGTMLRMLRCLPQSTGGHRTNLIGHTDVGSISMLFNKLGGLQILPAGRENVEENWVYVRPEPGCVVMNLGDAMVQWSGGVLRSNIHRVTTPPGQQAGYPRYSLAYLLRPEATGSMRRLKGDGVIPQLADGEEEQSLCARDWEKMRAAQTVVGKSLPKRNDGQRL